MSIPSSFRLRADAKTAGWGAAALVFAAVSAFVGFISLSMLEPAPTGALAGVHHQLEEARAGEVPPDVAERASALLDAARRAIQIELDKPWRLRSYDRAEALIRKAKRTLDNATAST